MGEYLPWGCKVWDNRQAYANPGDLPPGTLRWGWLFRRSGWPDAHGEAVSRSIARRSAYAAYKVYAEAQRNIAKKATTILKKRGYTTPERWDREHRRTATKLARQQFSLTAQQAEQFMK